MSQKKFDYRKLPQYLLLFDKKSAIKVAEHRKTRTVNNESIYGAWVMLIVIYYARKYCARFGIELHCRLACEFVNDGASKESPDSLHASNFRAKIPPTEIIEKARRFTSSLQSSWFMLIATAWEAVKCFSTATKWNLRVMSGNEIIIFIAASDSHRRNQNTKLGSGASHRVANLDLVLLVEFFVYIARIWGNAKLILCSSMKR